MAMDVTGKKSAPDKPAVILSLAMTIAVAGAVACDRAGDREIAVTDFLKSQVTQGLRDPSSAQFQSLHLFRAQTKGNDVIAYTLCGEVNATNGFGGYGGFRPFYSMTLVDAAGRPKASDVSTAEVRGSGNPSHER